VSRVHPAINENRKDGDKSVRIAILDTGVDVTHPQIGHARVTGKIKSFFPDSLERASQSDFECLDPLADRLGHGTHGTSLLLRIAPNATIYVARVAGDDGNLVYDGIVKVCSLKPQ
jgi:subtilisin family serine protease